MYLNASKLRLQIVLILVLLASIANAKQPAATSAAAFTKIKCPAVKEIAKELIEAELAGRRLGLVSKCSSPSQFPHILSSAYRDQNHTTLENAIIANEPKSYQITAVETQGDVNLVKLNWFVKRAKGSEKIPDAFSFSQYEGAAKNELGCAVVQMPPKQLVVKKSCTR